MGANKAAYDLLAQEYLNRQGRYVKSDKLIFQPFNDLLKDRFENVRVLELGPGSGLNLSFFVQDNFETTAIDISSRVIEAARLTSPKTEYIHSDFLGQDFKNQQYEGIFAKAFIHLFPKDDAKLVLAKIFSLLTENGVAFVATTLHQEASEGLSAKEDYQRKPVRYRKRWTEQELLDELRLTDFGIHLKYYHTELSGKKWINLLLTK